MTATVEAPSGAGEKGTASSVSPAVPPTRRAGRPAARRDSSEEADATARAGTSTRLLANLDVIVLIPAVLVALALGAPTFGVLVGAGAWLLQRLVALADRRVIIGHSEPGSRLGLNFIDAFARIWLLAGGIVVAGAVGSHQDGLAAALVIFGAYSIAFAVRIARGREGGPA